jgi:hypothetical protein
LRNCPIYPSVSVRKTRILQRAVLTSGIAHPNRKQINCSSDTLLPAQRRSPSTSTIRSTIPAPGPLRWLPGVPACFQKVLCSFRESIMLLSQKYWLDSRIYWLDSKMSWLDSRIYWLDSRMSWLDSQIDWPNRNRRRSGSGVRTGCGEEKNTLYCFHAGRVCSTGYFRNASAYPPDRFGAWVDSL